MHLIQLDMGRRNGTKKSKKSVPPAPYIAASVPVESSVRHDAAVETPDSEKRKSKGFGFGLFGYGSVSKSREPGGDITDENEKASNPKPPAVLAAAVPLPPSEIESYDAATMVGGATLPLEEDGAVADLDNTFEDAVEAYEDAFEDPETANDEAPAAQQPTADIASSLSTHSHKERTVHLHEEETLIKERLREFAAGEYRPLKSQDRAGNEPLALLPPLAAASCMAYAAARAGLRVVETRRFLAGQVPRGIPTQAASSNKTKVLSCFQLEKRTIPGTLLLVCYYDQSRFYIDSIYSPQSVDLQSPCKGNSDEHEGKEVILASVSTPESIADEPPLNFLVRWLDDAVSNIRVRTYGIFAVGTTQQNRDRKSWNAPTKSFITRRS